MADYLGIDVGTSFIKAAWFDLETLSIRRTERIAFPDFLPGLPPGHREVDPAAVLIAVDDLLQRAGPARPAGLALCGQMHGFVLLDGRGVAVSNYVSWLDQRVNAAEFEEFARRINAGERNAVGNEIRPGIALPLLDWMKRNGKLPQGATPVSIADFVAARLCGSLPAMDPTQAASFGALHLASLSWHRELIGKLGLDSLNWPRVLPSGSAIGTWRDAPCYAAVGDQQCALAGALLKEHELSVNIGTGSQVAQITDNPSWGELQIRPYFNGRFLRTITHIPGGRALSALLGLLSELGEVPEERAWTRVEAAVASVCATDVRAGVAFYPGPCGDGGFLENLREANMSVGHVFRAALESMASNYRACASRLDPDRSASSIVFSGGVARRLEILRQLTAAKLGLPWRLSPHPEDTLFGLMVLEREWTAR